LKYARGKKDFVCSALSLFIPKPLKSENQSVIIAVYALREAGNEKQDLTLNRSFYPQQTAKATGFCRQRGEQAANSPSAPLTSWQCAKHIQTLAE
jgi:hypothetical protein